MRCFYHEDKEAVGTCKSCGKGLCRGCAVDLTKGLACRGHCETDAQALIQLIDRNIQLSAKFPPSSVSSQIIQSGNKMRFATGVLMIAMGVSFCVLAQHDFERLKIFCIMGAVFIAYGIFVLFLSYSSRKNRT